MTKGDDRYTDPELRSQIKEEAQAGDKGGKPGQWSARKAQMMASEYKKQMHERGEEPYTTDKSEQSEGQKHLNEWTKEEWQTSEGKGDAKNDDGSEQRYLPKKAWENMTEEEKDETNRLKLEGSARGEQYVSNTNEAKKARKDVRQSQAMDADDEERTDEDEVQADGDNQDATDDTQKRGTKHRRNDEGEADAEGESDDKTNGGDEANDEATQRQPPAKQAKGEDGEKIVTRSHSKGEPAKADEDPDKKADEKQKGDEEHGQQASATRLPKEGQKVFWRASPGWVEGIVVEIAYSEKEVDGKQIKASQNDPRIVLQSAKSGKTAIHKPEAVYF